MRFIPSLSLILSSNLLPAIAFPTNLNSLHHLTAENVNHVLLLTNTIKEKRLFVDRQKPISITGKNVFRVPKDSDQRGPCPGLNALANHGYISRDGITSLTEVVTAINQGQPKPIP